MTTKLIYEIILLGLHAGSFVLFSIIFILIGSKSVYFSFLDINFGIHMVSKTDKKIILDVYGNRMNFSTNKRLRITLRILTLVCCYILTLVYVDGCILSRTILGLSDICPISSATECFSYESIFSFTPKEFFCPPTEHISAMNITAEKIICFTWEIKSQTLISLLNQLGICSSILCLLGLFFKSLYCLTRSKYCGILLTIILGLAMLIIPLCLWAIFRITISFIVTMLILAGIILVLTALFLFHTVRISNNQITIQPSTILDCKQV